MGYTHYWSVQRCHPDYAAAWPGIIDDTRHIIAAARDRGIVIAGPEGHARPILDPAEGIAFNGDATAELACETCYLPPPEPTPGYSWMFCKTDRFPYDLAVAAVLLRCRLQLPEVILIRSDGGWDGEWRHGAMPDVTAVGARQLVADLFGPVPEASVFHPGNLPGSPLV